VGRRRYLCLLVAWLICWQSAAFAGAALKAASCCCAHRGEAKCHCPACEHARELESDTPLIKTCGASAPAAQQPSPLPVLPQDLAPAVALQPELVPATDPPSLSPEPPSEVPTPPPLA
jgi:hypothetical protein